MLYAASTPLYHIGDDAASADVFQQKIDAGYQQSRRWWMYFNDKKCLAIIFGKFALSVKYKPDNPTLEQTDSTRFLGVALQTNLKFDPHITENCTKSQKNTGRHQTLNVQCPKEAKLLVYTSLCRPILEWCFGSVESVNKDYNNT